MDKCLSRKINPYLCISSGPSYSALGSENGRQARQCLGFTSRQKRSNRKPASGFWAGAVGSWDVLTLWKSFSFTACPKVSNKDKDGHTCHQAGLNLPTKIPYRYSSVQSPVPTSCISNMQMHANCPSLEGLTVSKSRH